MDFFWDFFIFFYKYPFLFPGIWLIINLYRFTFMPVERRMNYVQEKNRCTHRSWGCHRCSCRRYFLLFEVWNSFNDELDKDFHDYEDEETSSGETGKGTSSCDAAKERTYITLEPGKCKAGEEKNAEGPKDAEPAPETAPQEEPAEAVKEAASPGSSESATVEEDTDGAGK